MDSGGTVLQCTKCCLDMTIIAYADCEIKTLKGMMRLKDTNNKGMRYSL